jgi:hypothetical protein
MVLVSKWLELAVYRCCISGEEVSALQRVPATMVRLSQS